MSKNLGQIRLQAKEIYNKIGVIHCPYFIEQISFTSEGFNHIRYKKARSERHPKVQEIRYRLIKFAPEIIRNSKTLQEHDIQKLFIEVEHNNRKEKVLKDVQYFGFIAIIDGWKVKVIVRQIGNGKKHFWSVIPNWKTRKSIDGKKSYENYTGALELD